MSTEVREELAERGKKVKSAREFIEKQRKIEFYCEIFVKSLLKWLTY